VPNRHSIQKRTGKRMAVGDLSPRKQGTLCPALMTPVNPSMDLTMERRVQEMVAAALAKLARPSPLPGCSTTPAPLGDPWNVFGLAEAKATHKAEGERLSSLRRANEQQMQE
jgi:hypothetical protein